MPQNTHKSQLTNEEKIGLARAELEIMRARLDEIEADWLECSRRMTAARKILQDAGIAS